MPFGGVAHIRKKKRGAKFYFHCVVLLPYEIAVEGERSDYSTETKPFRWCELNSNVRSAVWFGRRGRGRGMV